MENKRIKFEANLKKYNYYLLITVLVFIMLLLLLFIIYKENENKEAKTLYKVYKENMYCKTELQLVSDSFAIDDMKKYYFAMDTKDYIHIVALDKDEQYKLQSLIDYTYSEDENAKQPEPIEIKGVTKTIEYDLKEIAIESYAEIFGENIIDKNNFEDYVSGVYLDTTVDSIFTQDVFNYIFLITIFESFFLRYYIKLFFVTKRTLKKCDLKGIVEDVYSQLEEVDTLEFNKDTLFLTRDYIVDITGGLKILRYDEINSIRPFRYVLNGVPTKFYFEIVDNNNKKICIFTISAACNKKNEETFKLVFDEIYKKVQQTKIS